MNIRDDLEKMDQEEDRRGQEVDEYTEDGEQIMGPLDNIESQDFDPLEIHRLRVAGEWYESEMPEPPDPTKAAEAYRDQMQIVTGLEVICPKGCREFFKKWSGIDLLAFDMHSHDEQLRRVHTKWKSSEQHAKFRVDLWMIQHVATAKMRKLAKAMVALLGHEFELDSEGSNYRAQVCPYVEEQVFWPAVRNIVMPKAAAVRRIFANVVLDIRRRHSIRSYFMDYTDFLKVLDGKSTKYYRRMRASYIFCDGAPPAFWDAVLPVLNSFCGDGNQTVFLVTTEPLADLLEAAYRDDYKALMMRWPDREKDERLYRGWLENNEREYFMEVEPWTSND